MKEIGSVVAAPFKALGLVPKIKKPAPASAPITRDDARDEAIRDDKLAARRGFQSNIITGSRGAEAGAGGKALLG